MQPDLTSLRTGAETAASDVNKVTESIPGLLSGLKTNLTSIFTKDNPMFAERENALQTFLNTPSTTRAELLPGNQPMVEGTPLNFSPTQQNAMVTARQNAALVPLAGLNQSIVGQYGNLADMLSSAGGIFQTQAQTAQQKAANALNLYKTAIDEYNAVTSRNKASESSGFNFGAIEKLIQAIQASQQPKPNPADFDEPDQSTSQISDNTFTIPGMGTFEKYTPEPISKPASRWNPIAQLGALGELIWGRPANQPIQPTNTFLNQPNLLGSANDWTKITTR